MLTVKPQIRLVLLTHWFSVFIFSCLAVLTQGTCISSRTVTVNKAIILQQFNLVFVCVSWKSSVRVTLPAGASLRAPGSHWAVRNTDTFSFPLPEASISAAAEKCWRHIHNTTARQSTYERLSQTYLLINIWMN